MSQRDVAFALELVVRALTGRMSTDPEDTNDASLYILEDVAAELGQYAATLRAAPVSDGFVWCERYDERPCTFHPLGGPDCEM